MTLDFLHDGTEKPLRLRSSRKKPKRKQGFTCGQCGYWNQVKDDGTFESRLFFDDRKPYGYCHRTSGNIIFRHWAASTDGACPVFQLKEGDE